MTKEDLLKLNFKEIPHFTIGDNMFYNLGRCRRLSISSIDTPNEFCYLIEVNDEDNPTEVMDAICVHNYDYDGYLSKEKIISLINAINGLNC